MIISANILPIGNSMSNVTSRCAGAPWVTHLNGTPAKGQLEPPSPCRKNIWKNKLEIYGFCWYFSIDSSFFSAQMIALCYFIKSGGTKLLFVLFLMYWQVLSRLRTSDSQYGMATISRHLKNTGLFCKRALQKRLYSAKETYNYY